MKNLYKAIILMLFSGLGYSIMNTFIKLSGDIPPLEKSFFRNLTVLIIAWIIIVKNKSSFWGEKKDRKYLLGRAIFGTVGTWANYYAIDNLIIADASMLNQLSPFFVIIFCAIFLKEKIKPLHIILIIIALIGVGFIARPSFSGGYFPYLVGLSSSIFAGLSYTFIQAIGKKEASITVVFFFAFIGVIMTIPFMIFNFKAPSFIQLLYLILSGLGVAFGQICLTKAYATVQAKDVSIFSYSQVIFTAILGFIIFGNIITPSSLIGYVIIISSAIVMFFYNKKLES